MVPPTPVARSESTRRAERVPPVEAAPPEKAPAPNDTEPASLWSRVVDLASEQTSDQVLVDQLLFVEEQGELVRLQLVDGSPSGESWITARRDRLEALLGQVTGRRVTVELIPPVSPGMSNARKEPDPKFRENALVREALQLFDATIQSVRELPDSRPNQGGAADDV